MSKERDDNELRSLLAPLDTIEPVRRSVGGPSRHRLTIGVGAGICALAVAGVAVAAGLGAFSSPTVSDLQACVPSKTALKAPSGAEVLTGRSDNGLYCLKYVDANGVAVGTAGTLSGPDGAVLPIKALDTASHEYVIVGIVPSGYDTLKTSSGDDVPITNQVFLAKPDELAGAGVLSGTAGTLAVNLTDLVGAG